MATETTTCPRRMNEMGPWEYKEGLDSWQPSHLAERGRVCSFCGGLHPDELLERIERGEEVIPTDKSTKVYVGPDHQKAYFVHLSMEQQRRIIELTNERKINFGSPGDWYVLPFFAKQDPGVSS